MLSKLDTYMFWASETWQKWPPEYILKMRNVVLYWLLQDNDCIPRLSIDNQETLRSAIRDMAYERTIALGLLELETNSAIAFAGYGWGSSDDVVLMTFTPTYPTYFMETKVRIDSSITQNVWMLVCLIRGLTL